jgi:putative lipoprotein
MKASIAFIFFMLFLAGIAFVNLRGMQGDADTIVTSPDQLVDVAWRPTHLGEMAVDDDTRIVLQFNADGRLGGNGGCNRFFGSYEFSAEGNLVIGMVGATRMACQEPVDSIETAFLEALGNVEGAARVDNRLALKDSSDTTLARFVAVTRDEP